MFKATAFLPSWIMQCHQPPNIFSSHFLWLFLGLLFCSCLFNLMHADVAGMVTVQFPAPVVHVYAAITFNYRLITRRFDTHCVPGSSALKQQHETKTITAVFPMPIHRHWLPSIGRFGNYSWNCFFVINIDSNQSSCYHDQMISDYSWQKRGKKNTDKLII